MKTVKITTTMVYEFEVSDDTQVSYEAGHSLMANSEPVKSYQEGLIVFEDDQDQVVGNSADFGLQAYGFCSWCVHLLSCNLLCSQNDCKEVQEVNEIYRVTLERVNTAAQLLG